MQTNFKKVVLSADGKTITASGDIMWEPGDDHCEIHVDLSQPPPPQTATITGSGDTGTYGTKDKTWECKVAVSTPHNGQWNPNLMVHCVGEADPPTSVHWPPQDLPLQIGHAEAA